MMKGSSTHSRVHSSPLGLKKLLIFSVNGVLCYFPLSAVLQRNIRVFGRNVDKAKVEVRAGVEDFLAKAFEKSYITIWFCMKLEDVLEVLPMFMLENFVDWFIFISRREQCLKIVGQISPKFHYYLKDLKHIYYGCMNCCMERRIQHYSWTMNLARHCIIPNGVVNFLNHLGDKCC